ncbi:MULTISPECIES: BLUF domain-containing protein [Vibrio]|uniref:BLUF domain-containing protein n=1 Tax=Vibrio TaxID=662 RepID=UPI000680692A|nr:MULTISPECIES: BLUF domain-containing protein [Vibrio]MDE3898577.1 BLUF domain-containing protein [Vibrio sp. CC007]
MPLSRLIYASTMSTECNIDEIDRILASARTHNERNHVSGVLHYSNRYFFQYLEGEMAQVEDTYERIMVDPRHAALRLIDLSVVRERAFGDWTMAYVPESESLAALHQQFCGGEVFDPRSLSLAEALQVFEAFKHCLPTAHCERLRERHVLSTTRLGLGE